VQAKQQFCHNIGITDGMVAPDALETAVRTSETLDNFKVQAVNGNRNDPWIDAVQPLQVRFAAVYRGNNSPDLAREPDRIISMEFCFHACVGLGSDSI
jgi:hypothetical protein